MTFSFRKLNGKLVSAEPLDEDAAPTWSRRQYLAMDAAYRNAVIAALERGDERLPEPPGRSRGDRVLTGSAESVPDRRFAARAT